MFDQIAELEEKLRNIKLTFFQNIPKIEFNLNHIHIKIKGFYYATFN